MRSLHWYVECMTGCRASSIRWSVDDMVSRRSTCMVRRDFMNAGRAVCWRCLSLYQSPGGDTCWDGYGRGDLAEGYEALPHSCINFQCQSRLPLSLSLATPAGYETRLSWRCFCDYSLVALSASPHKPQSLLPLSTDANWPPSIAVKMSLLRPNIDLRRFLHLSAIAFSLLLTPGNDSHESSGTER